VAVDLNPWREENLFSMSVILFLTHVVVPFLPLHQCRQLMIVVSYVDSLPFEFCRYRWYIDDF
jgi:hypothetical protein